ncbi:hypothetical protein SteCoe_14177 [Stentor coeruleus]|uniref:Uncharacterized protein n=1 Tax=Stentor coeruleus TaxID=5963 RepID=A0A1R2C6M1_9CILI|nr:hypothetical protein SteCoe_14177 [Stentor coeruleus]
MHYTVNVQSEAKFKLNIMQNLVVEEQDEESKSVISSIDSSLVTEEDTSGNPLPPEIVKIHKQNKQMQKDLTTGLMNFKSTSRSFINSSESIGDFEPSHEEPVKRYEPTDKVEIMTMLSNNEKLKGFLEQIIKLQSDYEHAKNDLNRNEQEICVTESELYNLKFGLEKIQEELKVLSETRNANKTCCCVLI